MDLAYTDYKKSNDIHGTILYPAVMVAPVQKEILESLIDPNCVQTIFDPFHGSGTSLYESYEVSKNVVLYGCDINPYANLITKIKLQGVSKNILNDIDTLFSLLNRDKFESLVDFHNIDKWFQPEIQIELQHIHYSIKQIRSVKNRLFFWGMFGELARRYSNSRTSTYKLHSKPIEVINKLENNVVKDFKKIITDSYKMYSNSIKNFHLYKGDTLEIMDEFEDNMFDISISSPPYGDNATTVPYGQFSILPLYWIDKQDLVLEGWELNNFAIIDSSSMGGAKSLIKFNDHQDQLISPYLNKISIQKQRKVKRFFSDYFIFLNKLTRISKNYIVLTLGNRTVDGINIDLTEVTSTYLESAGFVNEQTIEREIPKKRMPTKVSNVNNKPVSSINTEYVIIHKKDESIYSKQSAKYQIVN